MTILSLPLSVEFELLERNTQLTTILLTISLCSTLLVGISTFGAQRLMTSLFQNFIRLNQKEKEFKEALKIGFGANALLFLNFIVSFTLCGFLFIQKNSNIEGIVAWFISFGVTIAFILLQQIGYRFVAFLSGAKEIIDGISNINKNTWQFGGIMLLTLSYTWILDGNNFKIYSYIFLGILLLMLFLRIVKGILFSFNRRISWYYFILYLCTLEILPAIVLLKVAISNLSLGNVMVE